MARRRLVDVEEERMPKINPKDRDGGSDDLLPAGEYGLALVWFQRRVSKRGSEFLRVKVEVTDGPKKGRTAWLVLSLDLSKRGALNRWRILAESVGIEDEFELGSTVEGTAEEGDETIRTQFLGKPFRAKIKQASNWEYQNNDIESFVFQRLWSEGQKAAMNEWAAKWAAKKDDLGPPPDDDAKPSGEVDDWGTPPSFDDDIPF